MTPVEFHWNSAGMVERFLVGQSNKFTVFKVEDGKDTTDSLMVVINPHEILHQFQSKKCSRT